MTAGRAAGLRRGARARMNQLRVSRTGGTDAESRAVPPAGVSTRMHRHSPPTCERRPQSRLWWMPYIEVSGEGHKLHSLAREDKASMPGA